MKGGWLAPLFSLILSNNNGNYDVQYYHPYEVLHKPSGHQMNQHYNFTFNQACVSHKGKKGICQSLVECAGYNTRIAYMTKSTCELTQYISGFCCPIEDDYAVQDIVMGYAGSSSDHKNISITFPNLPIITTHDLNEACEIAILEMKARESFERDLVRRNIIAAKYSAVFWHAKLFQTTQEIFTLGSDATLVLLASISLVKRFSIDEEKVYGVLSHHSLSNTIIKDTCPSSPPCGDSRSKYRNYDGSCNNLLHGSWGATGATLRRLIPSHYADGVSVPRQAVSGHLLPSARLISSKIHLDKTDHDNKYTLLLMQWGQFLDHDITHTPLTKGSAFSDVTCCDDGSIRPNNDMHPECFPIQIPDDDPFYSEFGQRCMEFVRSMPGIRPHCTFGPRDQMNQLTSYIDGSMIYGTSHEDASNLRSFRKGRLKITKIVDDFLLPKNPSECRDKESPRTCFKAGDSRVNEQPQLATMHTVWVRHHNIIVKKLSRLNPHWDDETLFHEGRRIVGAQIQHITYNEFLPILLGQKLMSVYHLLPMKNKYFKGYRDDIDATVLNAFATAAFRFGHSLVTSHFSRYDSNGNIKDKLALDETQFSPFALYEDDGVACLVRGLIRQKPRTFDRYFTEVLTQRLFAFGVPFGLDLISLNIQRGRDHGLPPYVRWREFCGLKPAHSWEDLLVDMDEEVIAELQSVYDSIEDVDLFVGGVSEKPLNESILGPTFVCIIAKQFIRLKIGDRFFYENAPDQKYNRNVVAFSRQQLFQIRKTSFARILCSTVKNIGAIQPLAFISPNSLNQRVSCDDGGKIPFFSLHPWKIIKKNQGSKY